MVERRSLLAMLKDHWPTRESIGRNRFLKPFAKYLGDPCLWRLTRRSVPRGVALGLFVGLIIPILHTVIAALLAVPARANVAVSAGFTLLINPLTIPPIYYAAYRIGSWELHHDRQLVDPVAAERVSGELGRMLFWIHEASAPIAVGVLTLAVSAAAIGYFSSAVGWRWWRGSKWRERRYRRRGVPPPQES
ncbi:MAG: DUF2062 domain-containing protein [Pseudomonadota bacterium]|nr:DUF2062 domain-containing protein [Pseudomonadota bacterium]